MNIDITILIAVIGSAVSVVSYIFRKTSVDAAKKEKLY